jgi:hypothetical protein
MLIAISLRSSAQHCMRSAPWIIFISTRVKIGLPRRQRFH